MVAVELNPKAKQSDLVAALEPVGNRLISGTRPPRKRLEVAQARQDEQRCQRRSG